MPNANEGFILEYVQNGRYLKVSAIDPATGEEAVAIGANHPASKIALERQAINKLLKKLGKSA